jgi:hypothetical protein
MTIRTKGEQKAYLDGYEMCAECIEKYLTTEGKQKLECLLMTVRNAVEIEDENIEPDRDRKERQRMKEVTLELLIKTLINDFKDYQKEWLTSHNDIEFDRSEEDLILAFIDDTADCYISEHIS